MSINIAQGAIVISVDVDADRQVQGDISPANVERSAISMLKLLQDCRLPATWGSVNPADSPAIDHVGERLEHEVALIAQADWAGSEAGRGRFGREIARLLSEAELAGLKITSLVLNDGMHPAAWDIAAGHGISAIRRDVLEAARQSSGPLGLLNDLRQAVRAPSIRSTQPRCVYQGVWNIPASLIIPSPGKSRGFSASQVLRGLDDCLGRGGVFHLAIDLPRMIQGGAAGQKWIGQLLQEMSRRNRTAGVRFLTLEAAASGLSAASNGSSARSILRAA